VATYKIEVRERAEPPSFLATYRIDAIHLARALQEARRRFLEEHPDKDINNYSFLQGRH
jgi:hypothetical protein